jgi:predicted Zn-dependent protease
MSEKPEDLFQEGFDRYQAGEDPKTLITFFKDLCNKAPKNSNSWTSLSWLYLLENQPDLAYKAGKTAVKLNPHDAQARVNLSIAMLELGQKGVRDHIEMAQNLILISEELLNELKRNFEDGAKRKPDWKSLNKVKNWLFE